MWETTTDPREFREAAGAFLRSNPVEHTVLLTVSDRLVRDGGGPEAVDALLGWWTNEGEVAGAFLHTPPYKLLIAAPPEAAAELGRELRHHALDGVNGEESVAAAFA